MLMMHTKLIRMKWEVLWDMMQVNGVDQEYICGPGVPLQIQWVVQDAHYVHQTDQAEVESVM
jgi:hypothetical protein